jgi:hypothetical protein
MVILVAVSRIETVFFGQPCHLEKHWLCFSKVTVLFSVRPNGTKLTSVVIFKKAKETELNVE